MQYNPLITHLTEMVLFNLVFSRRNATNQMPFCEMPLTVVFEVWGFGVGESIFVVKFWEMAFRHSQNLNNQNHQSACIYYFSG